MYHNRASKELATQLQNCQELTKLKEEVHKSTIIVEKMNKTDKPLAKLIKKQKKGETNHQYAK